MTYIKPIHKKEIEISKKIADKYDSIYGNLIFYIKRGEKIINEIDRWCFQQKKSKEKVKILDCGCGTGSLLKGLEKKGYRNLWGVDISKNMIRIAKTKTRYTKYLISSIEGLGNFEKDFDIILGTGVLHHLINLEEVFSQFNKLLSKGGFFIFFEPHKDGIINNKKKKKIIYYLFYPFIKFFMIKNRKWIESIKYLSDDEYYSSAHRHLSIKELKKTLNKNNLEYKIEKKEALPQFFEGFVLNKSPDKFFYYLITFLDKLLFEKLFIGNGLLITGNRK